MSIDTGAIWSAASLQAPVHAQLARLNSAVRRTSAGMQNRIFSGPRPAPAPVTRTPMERSILAMGAQQPQAQQPVVKPSVDLMAPAAKPAPGTNVTQTPVKVVQPGIDTNIATAIPGTPEDGVPKMSPVSGWLSAGNFNTR